MDAQPIDELTAAGDEAQRALLRFMEVINNRATNMAAGSAVAVFRTKEAQIDRILADIRALSTAISDVLDEQHAMRGVQDGQEQRISALEHPHAHEAGA